MYERAVFKPLDPTADSESWPQFFLSGASVYTVKGRNPIKLADLLDVQTSGPLRVKGRLRRVPAKFRSIIKPVRGSNKVPPPKLYTQDLIITQVTTYSLESFDNGDLRIWALGSAGWYALDPSPEYEEIYYEMLQKARAWDTFQEMNETEDRPLPTLQELFERFAEDQIAHEKVRELELADVPAYFDAHRKFIMTKMFEPAPVPAESNHSGFKWGATALYRYYAEKYPELVEEVKDLLKTPKDTVEDTDDESDAPDSSGDTAGNEESTSAKEGPGGVQGEESDVQEDPVPPRSNRHRRGARRGRGMDGRGRGSADRSKRGSASEVKTPKRGGPSRRPNPVDEEDGEIDGSSSGSDNEQIRTRSSKGKSVLRPARTRDDIPIEPPSPLELQGDDSRSITVERLIAPGTAPGLSTRDRLKRKATDDSSQTEGRDERFLKRLRSFEPSVSSSSGDRSADEAVKVNWPELKPGRGRPPMIVSKLLSTSSNRSGGHWICSIDSCQHEILDAGTRSGRRAIEEHYQMHEKIVKEAMAVIGVEAHPSNGVHKIDNLLAKIEDMAKRWSQSRPQPLRGLGP